MDQPLLYLSLAFKREQPKYYSPFAAVRSDGDWEGWIGFFLACVREASEDGVHVAQALHAFVVPHRSRIIDSDSSTVLGQASSVAEQIQNGMKWLLRKGTCGASYRDKMKRRYKWTIWR